MFSTILYITLHFCNNSSILKDYCGFDESNPYHTPTLTLLSSVDTKQGKYFPLLKVEEIRDEIASVVSLPRNDKKGTGMIKKGVETTKETDGSDKSDPYLDS